ncbi:ABC transporter ATP-binding protein [Myxococcaceae bacterium GXIMD 01537]
MEAAIEARGLTKRYGAFAAVDALDLDVRRGAVCGFLGPNGAGKTTTIRMLLGLVRPTAGTARILGRPLEDRAALCTRVGAIIETPAFYPFLSGEENLRVLAGASAAPVPRTRVAALLERVGLEERARDKAGTYSLGMRQRLGIASALLTDPELLFLDEPTNGLDPAGMQEVRALLGSLAQEGRTVFVSSHQLGEVEQVCTDIVILQRGVKKLQGSVASLLEEGRRLEFQVSPVARAVEVLAALPALEPRAEGDTVWVKAERDAVPALVRALVGSGVDVYGVSSRAPSLEQRFLELTGGAR